MAIEGAADDQAQGGDRGFQVPAPAERRQGQVGHRVEAAVDGFADRARGDLRVDEDRLPQGRGGGEQVVVARVVQRRLGRAPVDHRSDEPETGRTFELRGGGLRVRHRQGGEGPQPRGVPPDGLGGDVVGPPAERSCVRRLQRLCTGWRQREDLQVDALGVHRRDPGVADVVEALEVVAHLVEHDARVAAVFRERLHGRGELGQVPVFFDRDECHARSPDPLRAVHSTAVE